VIYVFFILANNQGDGITTVTRANFSVDDGLLVPFHIPDLSTTALQYNSLVFSRTNFSNRVHRLDITTTGSTNTYINFYYAIYTLVADRIYRSRFLIITFLNIIRMIPTNFINPIATTYHSETIGNDKGRSAKYNGRAACNYEHYSLVLDWGCCRWSLSSPPFSAGIVGETVELLGRIRGTEETLL
jgi:hypothetical protein